MTWNKTGAEWAEELTDRGLSIEARWLWFEVLSYHCRMEDLRLIIRAPALRRVGTVPNPVQVMQELVEADVYRRVPEGWQLCFHPKTVVESLETQASTTEGNRERKRAERARKRAQRLEAQTKPEITTGQQNEPVTPDVTRDVTPDVTREVTSGRSYLADCLPSELPAASNESEDEWPDVQLPSQNGHVVRQVGQCGECGRRITTEQELAAGLCFTHVTWGKAG